MSEEKELTIRDCVKILEKLGIEKQSEQKIKKLEDEYGLPEDMIDDLQDEDEDGDMIKYILYQIGEGKYNYEQMVWTPTSKVVYAFDGEVYNMDYMYTKFLQGITSINNSEFTITDVQEEVKEMHRVSFQYNGHSYTFEGEEDGEWIDGHVINFMNEVFEKEHNPKRLFPITYAYQCCIILYNTPEWAEKFELDTGCEIDED